MVRIARLIVAAAVALFPVTASAESVVHSEAGGWTILRDTSDAECTMTADFKNNSTVFVSYIDRIEKVTVAFSDPSVKSLKNGDTRKLNTYFTNGDIASFDDGWADKTFMVADVEGVRYFSRIMDKEFLVDLARYKKVGFFYKDVILMSFDLSGTAEAVAALRSCARAAQRANPSDPFADEAK